MHHLGELITGQVKGITTTSLYYPPNYFASTLSGVRLEGDKQNILQEVRHSPCNDTQEESVAKAARELQKDKG
jgi:hypothetical protein